MGTNDAMYRRISGMSLSEVNSAIPVCQQLLDSIKRSGDGFYEKQEMKEIRTRLKNLRATQKALWKALWLKAKAR